MPQIKFLNRFVLANILKNFRWLKIRLHDILNNLNCPRCYSLSLRYSIYKVQFASHRFAVTAFELYHTQFRLSRTFFKFFQTFLRRFLRSLLAEQPRYVSTSASICQVLFSVLFKFLSDLLFYFVASRRLAYTSIYPPFCQAFFPFFLFILGLIFQILWV